jgi:hypothetical protein
MPNQTPEQMKQSREAGLPEYNWIPPVWAKQTDAAPKLVDTADTKPTVPDIEGKRERATESFPGEQTPAEPTPGQPFRHGYKNWVHPDSDFTHTDPPLWDDADMDVAKKFLSPSAKPQLDKLRKLVGRESLGMQRLAAVFEWILFRANEHLEKINAGLGLTPGSSENFDAYTKARDAYIAFLKDLDDREPQERGRKIVPGKPGESGYGKAIKWCHIYPFIVNGRITAAKVAIQWNPHSSSNGIPVPHT